MKTRLLRQLYSLVMFFEAAVTNSNPAPSSNQDRVLQNFRTLFVGYRSTSPVAPSFTKRSQTKSFPPGKRSRSSRQEYHKVRETRTRDFLCLADKDLQVATTQGDKLALLAAGLGRKRLTFGNKDGALIFKGKLVDAYPKLKQGGGSTLSRMIGFFSREETILFVTFW